MWEGEEGCGRVRRVVGEKGGGRGEGGGAVRGRVVRWKRW